MDILEKSDNVVVEVEPASNPTEAIVAEAVDEEGQQAGARNMRPQKRWMRNVGIWNGVAMFILFILLSLLMFKSMIFNSVQEDIPSAMKPSGSRGANNTESSGRSTSKHNSRRSSGSDSSEEPTDTSEAGPRAQGCVFSDRFDNEHNFQHNRLYPGQYICSDKTSELHRYRFGLNQDGDLVLEDTLIPDDKNDYDKVLYENPNKDAVGDEYYISMQTDGKVVIHVSDHEEWSVMPDRDMSLKEQCIEDHDCPYLHLNNGGVLVVNYIDDDDQWQAKNTLRVYGYKGKY